MKDKNATYRRRQKERGFLFTSLWLQPTEKRELKNYLSVLRNEPAEAEQIRSLLNEITRTKEAR
jgi:acetolactate synthase small subunit